jgi:hypothetical protein
MAKRGDIDQGVVSKVRAALIEMRPQMTPTQMRARIIELCRARKYDPVAAMIDMAQNDPLDADQKIAIHRELAQYVAPKVRAVDVSGEVDLSITVRVKKFGDDGREIPPGIRAIPGKIAKRAIDAEVIDGD